MASVNYSELAAEILKGVGGEQNIATATHCATRLRLTLRDDAQANDAAVEKLPGVITVMKAGGQYQVVIGNDVPAVYAEIGKLTRFGTDTEEEEAGPKGNIFNRFIQMISAIFSPILWTLAAAGLFKAFLSLADTLGWVSPESSTYVVLAAAADALFFFLPLFLAITAAKRFKASQFTAMAIAGALVYPSIVALNGTSVDFIGIPFNVMNYTSSVIPIIVAVWLQGYLERFLLKVLPSAIRNFTTPLLTMAFMVPLTLLTVGPATIFLANALSNGITALFGFAPWLAGALLGGFWQVFVVFGLHWGLVPVMLNDIGTLGYSVMLAPLVPAVLAQSAAMLAVAIRSHSAKRREVAFPAAFSGFLAGVTEPGIYGVNLPLKKPFYFGIVGGAIGGAIVGIGGSAANAFVFPSLIGLPAFAGIGSFATLLIGTGIAIVIAFLLTFFFGPRETPDTDDAGTPVESSATTTVAATEATKALAPASGNVVVFAPVTGTAVALSEVPDKVFASGAMGSGLAFIPEQDTVHSPVSGTVQVAMKTGHAYGLKTDSGVEVLVHIGIDTVQMQGEGFTSAVTRGQRVEAGDLLATIDRAKIKDAGFSDMTIMVVTNTKKLTAVVPVGAGRMDQGVPALDIEL